MLAKIAGVIWVIELFIMKAFEHLPKMSEALEGLVDASLLSFFSSLVIYAFILKPRIAQTQGSAELVFNNLIEGFVDQDSDGKIVDFNPAALTILGLSADQLRGRTSRDPNWKAIRPDGTEFPGEEHPAMVALRTGKLQRNIVMGIELASGERRWLLISSIPQFHTGKDRPFRVLTTFSNITAQKLAEQDAESSHELLRAASSLLKIGAWQADAASQVLTADKTFRDLLDLNAGEAIPKFNEFEQFVLPEDLERYRQAIAAAVKNPAGGFRSSFGIKTKKGNVKYFLAAGTFFFDQNGGVQKIIGATVDFTEYRSRQNRDEQIFSVIEKTMIYSTTKLSGDIVSVNEEFEKISGYSQQELIGENHRILNSGIHSKEFFQRMWSTIISGQVWSGEICNRHKGGDLYWIQAVISPVMGIDGKIERIMAISVDISEQKQAEKLLLQSSKMASLGQMASGVAHEINNPLAIIMGRATQIRRLVGGADFNPENVTQGVLKIEETVQRIAKIVRGLQAFSRNADGDKMQMVNISSLVSDTLALCQERFKNHEVVLQVDCPTSEQVECRAAQIEQVLMNLLGNAFDAVEALPEKWVKLSVVARPTKIEISVMDSGQGIPRHIVDRLMEPFFTTKPVGKGTGLGLSISKGLVEQHQGEFRYDFQSTNTRFVIELPYRQVNSVRQVA